MAPETQLQPGLHRRDYITAVQPSASALPPGAGVGDPQAAKAASRATNHAAAPQNVLGAFLRRNA